MTELTVRELDAVLKHLKKVNEIQDLNDDYGNHADLEIPESIALNRNADGVVLGHIRYSGDLAEHVFVPEAEQRVAPAYYSPIPLPPSFD